MIERETQALHSGHLTIGERKKQPRDTFHLFLCPNVSSYHLQINKMCPMYHLLDVVAIHYSNKDTSN